MKNTLEGPVDIDGISYMMVQIPRFEYGHNEYKSKPLSCCDRCAFDVALCPARCCDEGTKCSFFTRYEEGKTDNR